MNVDNFLVIALHMPYGLALIAMYGIASQERFNLERKAWVKRVTRPPANKTEHCTAWY